MSFKTGLYTLISVICLAGLLYILPTIATLLWYFVLFLLIGSALSLIGYVVLNGLIAKEKYLTERGKRKQQEYITQVDGHGMLHLINVITGYSQNLTIDTRAYRNGHYAPPSLDEKEATRLVLSKKVDKELLTLPAPIQPTPELMTILDNAQRVLIKAASNGGKTTLLQHVASKRSKTESVLILDSQSYPDKWPKDCKVVGTGSNHQAITVALDNLIELMVKRYQEIGQGLVKEGQHPKLTIIIDEWMAIVSECPNASDAIRRLLTESRKAAFSVFIGSHSERVKSLGLDGRGDLRDGFLIVRIDMEEGERKATYDEGRGEKPCLLPGEFIQVQQSDLVEIEAIDSPIPTDEESKVLEMVEAGHSQKIISEAIWGEGKFGRFYNAKIEATCRKFGVEVRSLY